MTINRTWKKREFVPALRERVATDDERPAGTGWMRDLPAWIISLVVNLTMLLILHNIVHHNSFEARATTITSVLDEIREREYRFTDVATTDMVGNEGESTSLTPTMQAATMSGDSRQEFEKDLQELLTPTAVDFDTMADVPLQDQLASIFENKGQTDNVPGGVEGAMDRVAFEIATSLKERQTLVLWLFDASGSLRDRRDAIAKRFESIYRQLETGGKTEGLYTAIASYGQQTELLTNDPVADVTSLIDAIRQTKVDESGVENVFNAVYQVVDKWKRFRRTDGRWNKMVFIVTDERGDDLERLEDVITLCKRYGVRCYTIGNAAIFGRRQGYVDYQEEDGYLHQNVVVDQGPETAFPERVRLAYWGGGGEDRLLQRVSAGFGPYGLTRLCAETGGAYFITEENRGYKFDMAVMREYTPDYRPVKIIESEIQQQPAKSFLVQAALAAGIDNVPSPQLAFRADNDNILRQQITEAQKPLADFKYHVDKIHSLLEQGEKARESLTEPRWCASYDLAMGRIRATLVRGYGYNVMLANMKSSPQPFTNPQSNLWRLEASEQIETGPSVRKYAEQAETYLKRVIDEHPGTPWAALAERELRQPLGWQWNEGFLDIPAIIAGTQDASPQLLLEEERQERARNRKEPTELARRPPKL